MNKKESITITNKWMIVFTIISIGSAILNVQYVILTIFTLIDLQ